MKPNRDKSKLAKQVSEHSKTKVKKKKKYDGNFKQVISTGCTLLDLAISGKIIRGGGLPSQILVEIFGPSGCGKSVLLSEIGGRIQATGGDVSFFDPEARLSKAFAAIFDLDFKALKEYNQPDTVKELFENIHNMDIPDNPDKITGIMADSLAALSTEMEMTKKDGDKMGMKRAKDFSEQLRKTARFLVKKNLLMVCSNQLRENADASMFAEKTTSPGGKAIGFYSSLRLRCTYSTKIKKKKKYKGKDISKVIGVCTSIDVYKSSIDEPYREAKVYIIFDYGIDDIRGNLQYIKDHSSHSVYSIGTRKLDKSMDISIDIIEKEELEEELREEVIDLWELIQSKFKKERIKKRR